MIPENLGSRITKELALPSQAPKPLGEERSPTFTTTNSQPGTDINPASSKKDASPPNINENKMRFSIAVLIRVLVTISPTLANSVSVVSVKRGGKSSGYGYWHRVSQGTKGGATMRRDVMREKGRLEERTLGLNG